MAALPNWEAQKSQPWLVVNVHKYRRLLGLVLLSSALIACQLCAHLVWDSALYAGTTAAAPYPLQTQPPYTVALDAGHGGQDPGAQALIDEVRVCEDTVNALYALLESDPNYTPVRTRLDGEDLSTTHRAEAGARAQASLLLSIHANLDRTTRQSHGFECFPTPPGRLYAEQAMRFAQCIAQQMQVAGHRLRGENGVRFVYYSGKSKRFVESSDTKVRSDKSFGIVEKPACPSVLVEQCFLSNYEDVENWTGTKGAARAASAYYQAICEYFGTVPALAQLR